MAISKHSYDCSSASTDPVGNAAQFTKISDFIVIDTILAGIIGDGGVHFDISNLLEGASTSSLILEIGQDIQIKYVHALPAGSSLRDTYTSWSSAYIALLTEEVFYIQLLPDGTTKYKPYYGYKMGSSTDKIYVEIDNTANTVQFYW